MGAREPPRRDLMEIYENSASISVLKTGKVVPDPSSHVDSSKREVQLDSENVKRNKHRYLQRK